MAEVTPHAPLPPWKAKKVTRYYEFTRINPKAFDYMLLINRCKEINAYLGYFVEYHGGKVYMKGFVVPPHRSVISDIQRMFPNFNFTHIEDFSVTEKEVQDASGALFFNCHRFSSVKRLLDFSLES